MNGIKELLNKENDKIELKKNINLIKYSKDALKNRVDVIKLEFYPYCGKYGKTVIIEERKFDDVIARIAIEIENFYVEYGKCLANEIKNGYKLGGK